jgi:ATP-binding cassette, subfamily F, member 3
MSHTHSSHRGTRFTLSRDELLTLPEFVLLSLFPNGLLPDGHMNSYHDGDVYPVDVSVPSADPPSKDKRGNRPTIWQSKQLAGNSADALRLVLSNPELYLSDVEYYSEQYDPHSLQYMLDFFRQVAQTIPQSTPSPTQQSQDGQQPTEAIPIEPMAGSARDMLQDRAGIIVLREDLDFYCIPPRKDIDATEMLEVKRAAGKALLKSDGIFSGLKKSEEPGTTEQHLIEMLTAGYSHSSSFRFCRSHS